MSVSKSGDETIQIESGKADLEIESLEDGTLKMTVGGWLDVDSTAAIWRRAVRAVDTARPARLLIDAHGLVYCDGAGIGLFFQLGLQQRRGGRETEVQGLQREFRSFLERYDPEDFLEPRSRRPTFARLPEEVGRTFMGHLRDLHSLLAFVGELSVALLGVLARPRRLRWGDVLLTSEQAGVNAFPIIALITFLIGLIMAFQSAIPMGEFGAEIFVADLVALSIVKELGPLMTAIMLAGRSGSAFAAEIGTMKVNEEVSALVTMGLNPIRFLVLPRTVAAVLVTPLLAMLASVFGLLGGAVVFVSLGIPLVTYQNRVIDALTLDDLLSGLFKAFVFGVIVAAIGCLRGLQTGNDSSAVGQSATRAVVTGILLIIVTDGIFAVVFYYLGI